MNEKNTITDKRLFYKFNIAQRLLMKYIDREMIDILGVPMIQTAALFHLEKNDGCLLKDLSEVLFQNKSATTTLVERMEKNGLIKKEKSEKDGRAYHLFLTDKGKKTIKKAHPLLTEYNKKLVEKFTDKELESVHHFLDEIIKTYK